jgi:hypothetical protein
VIDEDELFDILRKTAPQPPESPEPVEEEEEEEAEEGAAPPAEVPRPMGVNMGVKREGGALSSTSTGSAAGAGSRSGAGAGASSSASSSKAPGGPAPARMPREATGDEAPPLWAEKYRPTAKTHLVGNADQARRPAGLSDGMLIGSLIRRSYLLASLRAC